MSHYAEGQGESAACGPSVVFEHHLISHITIMLLAVLISRRRTLLSTPVWDVFARLFCLKSSRRAGEEHTLLFYCEHETIGICVFPALRWIFFQSSQL